MLYMIFRNPEKAWTDAIAADQSMNAATGGNEDETISSRAQRARSNGRRWGCILCVILDSIQEDHCNKSKGV